MKVNFKVEAKDWKGNTLTEMENGAKKPVLLSDRIQELLYFYGSNGQVSNDKKYKAHKLLKKMERGEDEFTTEELALVKEIVGNGLVAGIVGQVYDLIEENNQKTNKNK